MPDVPGELSLVPQHQVIPAAILAEISDFIRTFDRVTGRMAWQGAALREAPVIARLRRPEVCFFSAWDSHLPPEGGCWAHRIQRYMAGDAPGQRIRRKIRRRMTLSPLGATVDWEALEYT
jgi:hypothetical protein